MRILFLHPNFPAQFRHLATALARDPNHQVLFGTKCQEGSIPGVKKILYIPNRDVRRDIHHYLHSTEGAVLEGQAAYRMAVQLKAQGFIPDVIFGHSGWGSTMFMKDVFPKTPLLCYFEWFNNAHGSDADFNSEFPLSVDRELRIRVRNTPILLDLYSADMGITPTQWQHQQFPKEYRNKIQIHHDGINTDFFKPNLGAKLVMPQLNLDLSHVNELVTYVARGMEPYRGFPQFMEAVALIHKRRPNCHVVVVGADRIAYGPALPNGKTYMGIMLEKLCEDLDLTRIHFTGMLPYYQYLQVLQASSVHAYLTVPFVLSWSMLEAMSAGCMIVASNTAPVREVVEDGVNGLLVDFFSPQQIADRIDEALKDSTHSKIIRAKARKTIEERYSLKKLMPEKMNILLSMANK
jgi:glycosyltransferase involved in cell wall biosynthesis